MAIMHHATLTSKFIYDKWAVINFKQEMEDKQKCLSKEDGLILYGLLEKFLKIDIDKLPKAFVHGDIISTNIIKDNSGKLWIIDFAVSNYLPRIIDLAVSACNLCFDQKSRENTIINIKEILNEYQKYNKLTDYEKEVFPIFFDVANAMGILQISYLSTLGEISKEDKFWYDESKVGLIYSNANFWKEIIN